MNPFNLEEQYQFYLNKVNMQEAAMPPTQRTEIRRAFMGACGIMLIMLRDDLAKLSDDAAVDTLDSMTKQVGEFFAQEVVNFEIKKQQKNN